MQTIKDIGVIEYEKTGVYRKKYRISDEKTIKVLLLVILHLHDKVYEISVLASIPQVFPFEFQVSYKWLYDSGLFSLYSFGGKIVLMID